MRDFQMAQGTLKQAVDLDELFDTCRSTTAISGH